MIARRSIRDEYEVDKKEALLETLKEELLGADIELTADYAAIWKELVDGKKVKFLHQSPMITDSLLPRLRRARTLTCGTMLAALAVISVIISTELSPRSPPSSRRMIWLLRASPRL